MSNRMQSIAIAAIVLSASAATASAEGYGFIKSNISQFGGPVQLTMEYVGGSYRLKSATTPVPISYEAGYKGTYSYLEKVDVQVRHITKGNGSVHGLRRQLAEVGDKDKVWGNANLQMTRAHLAPMEKLGQDVCASHHGPGVKQQNTVIPLTMIVYYFDNANIHSFERHGDVPAKIVCPGGQPTPGGIAHDQGTMKVQAIALNFGGAAATKPNPATVCKQAKLSVTVNANQAGAVKFRLHKKVGAAPLQAKLVEAWAKHDGKGLFVASYQELISVTKTTSVQAMAEDLVNPIGLTTPWKDVTLRCDDIGGGLAGTPGNANPDNGKLPKQPKQPKRVLDGPSTLTPGARPVIAPATPKKPAATKTAPVPGERSSRYIGNAIQQ